MIIILKEVLKVKCLKINFIKTKVIVVNKNEENLLILNFKVNGIRMEQENQLCYLGSFITGNGRCNKKMRKITIAREAFDEKIRL